MNTPISLDDEIFRLLVGEMSDYGIVVLNKSGEIQTWNQGAKEHTGYTEEEALGHHFSFLFSEQEIEIGDNFMREAAANGRCEDERWLVRRDGTRIWGALNISKLNDQKGDLLGFSLVIRDQTKRKLTEDRLQVTRLMVSHLREYALYLLSPSGNVLTWNEGAQRLKGYTASEIVGRHFSTFYSPEDVEAGVPDKELEIAKLAGRYEKEGWRRRKDGSRFWGNLIITALRDEDGDLQGFGSITRDLTATKQTEQQLNEYAHRLELARDEALQASMLKSQFVANVSHEIRTPMSGLLGMAELLKYEDLNEQARDIADHIYSSAVSLLDILNDLLDFSKIEAGKMTIEKRPVELQSIVQNVVRSAALPAEQKSLPLRVQIDNNLPRHLVGDPLRLQQVLMNFVSNAIKFTLKGEVKIALHNAGRDEQGRQLVQFVVEDTGIGIEPDKQAILFQPFVQADGSTTRRFGGTGLGLSISKRLVDLMAGRIGIESEAGKGSRFWFTVPLEFPNERQATIAA